MKKILTFLSAIFLTTLSFATTYTINSGSYYYTPSSLSVNIGDTVEWINDGGLHNVNGDINSITNMSFNNPQTFYSAPVNVVGATLYTHVFTIPGTYNYDCSVGQHAAQGMIGTIVVNSNTIYDIVSNSNDHTTLEVAIDACALDGTLSGPGSFTLFAPTDAAFNLLPAGTVTALLNDIPQLTDILKHHVVAGSVMSGMLSNGQVVTTLLGTDITVTINTNGDVFIDNAQVTVADIVADNGVVHVIDAVLLPPSPPSSNSIYDIVSNSTDHTTLKLAIDACALDGVLSQPGPFTLFAPTDAAFNLLPAGTVSSLIGNIPLLTDILKHHVVADSVMSGMLTNGQVVTTLLGTDVTVTINSNGDVFIDNAQVILADLTADNGVVHVIDAVLLPTIDCFGIVNGTALTDTCGTCHQAYLYNFQTNVPTFVDNANILVAGVDYDPATEALIFPNDPNNPLWASDPALCTNSIYDIVSNSVDHTILEGAIDACSLDSYLSGAGPFTLFAPTDAAFNLLPQGTVTALLANIPQLADILKHHVVADSVMSGMLTNGQVVTTLLGTDVTVTINSNGDVFIDNAQVIVADLIGDNGVVHVIDAVLLPPTNTIYDIVSNSTDHTTLKAAIDACALDGTLSGAGPFTLFAPTDAAFNLLPAGTVTALLADIPQLTDILKHHVVADGVMSGMLSNGQIVTTLSGTDVTVTITNGMVYIDNAQVIVADIIADNGVVHVIDAVLLPSPTSVSDMNNELKGEYLYSVNILGERVNKKISNQIIFDIFNNGDVKRRFIR
jgi:uncharacterized surface protein with fasciclin (FAS1) repeats